MRPLPHSDSSSTAARLVWFTRLLPASLATAVVLAGCSTPPQVYPSPTQAVESLVVALRSNDEAELKRILGSDSKELLSSGDEVADANGRAEFLRLYDEQHRLVDSGDGFQVVEVGANAWPLPIPVVQSDAGWFFDAAAGADELLNRRIGENELSAIQVCLAIADAQREYAVADFDGDGWRGYAMKFRSDEGKRNGLYWPATSGEPESPLGELVVQAAEEGYFSTPNRKNRPQPYHGYCYRILTAQGADAPGGAINYVAKGAMIGGFAVIAWPAEYGSSGLNSFLVSHHGTVYERDLGDNTERIARSMTEFNPGPGWQPADTTVIPQ